MKTNLLLRQLAKYFPKRIKSKGDFVGLMTGKLKEDTNHIVLCLDLDEISLNEILKLDHKPDLILTHHPFIYGTRYRTLKYDEIKRDLVLKVDELDLPVYSMHTNFDTGCRGMNDALAKKMGLTNIRPLELCSMARGGELKEEMEIHEFVKKFNKIMGLEYSLLVHAGKDMIKSIAIVGGGGSRRYKEAMKEGYDLFISGDAPHHVRREVIANHYNYLEVSHEVERIFMPTMKELLLEFDPNLRVDIIDHEKIPELIK